LGGFGGFIFPIIVLTARGQGKSISKMLRSKHKSSKEYHFKKKDLAILRSEVSISVGAYTS